MDARALAAAVTARAVTSPHFLTYQQGQVDARPAKGYVVLLFGAGAATTDGRLSQTANLLRWSFRPRCVAYSVDTALFIAGKVDAMFVHWQPDGIAGRWFVSDGDDPPVVPDELEGETRYSITPRFILNTIRS